MLSGITVLSAQPIDGMNAAYKEAGDRAGQAVVIEGWWRPPADKKDKDAPATLAVMRVEEMKKVESHALNRVSIHANPAEAGWLSPATACVCR